jgi:hypothetical protein
MSDGMPPWVEEFPGAVTISGLDGTILYLNDRASAVFAKQGGREALLGSDLMACHTESSRAIIRSLLEGKKTNAYTIAKGDVQKFIYQAPWYKDGEVAGLVELSMEIQSELPHFERG